MNIQKQLDVDTIKRLKNTWLSPNGPSCYECEQKDLLNVGRLYIIFSPHSSFKEYLVYYCDACISNSDYFYIKEYRLLSEKEVFVYNIL